MLTDDELVVTRELKSATWHKTRKADAMIGIPRIPWFRFADLQQDDFIAYRTVLSTLRQSDQEVEAGE